MKQISKIFLSKGLLAQHRQFTSALISFLNNQSISPNLIDNTKDIWLRDFMPIQVAPTEFVQFSLTRNYYNKEDRHKQTDPTPICKALDINPTPIICNSMPIYLDGGNVIRGYGKAIITEKVFNDNKDIPPADLVGILRDALQVDQVIFIPVEPLDETGHSDGMVRFVDELTVLANDYLKIDVPQDFRDRFYGALDEAGLEVLLVPYNPSEERINRYQSAVGCYINFLQVGDKVFLPTFEDPVNDAMAIKRFEEIYGLRNIIPIPSHDVAKGGGVLNCLSWEIFPDGE